MRRLGHTTLAIVACICGVVRISACGAAEVASTNNWFDVSVSTLTGPIAVGDVVVNAKTQGRWTAVPGDDGCIVENQSIVLDTDYSSPLAFAPKTTDEPLQSILMEIVVTDCESLESFSPAKTALCVHQGEQDLAPSWYALVGGNWTKQSGETPEVGAEYQVLFEADVPHQTVRYSVRKAGAAGFTALGDWLSCAGLTAQVTNVAFFGSTTISNFFGKTIRKAVVDNPANIAVVVVGGSENNSQIFVDKESSWMKSAGVEPADMNTVPANGNGMTYLQSYVLGLDPKVPTAKPIVAASQDASTDKVSFRLAGVNVNEASGARVRYRVKAFASAGAAEPLATSAEAKPSECIMLDLPSGDTKVRYYKVEVTVE